MHTKILDEYAHKILDEAGLKDCNPTKFPMEPGLRLSKNDESGDADATQFRKWVGCLRYLTHTRPDLSYFVGYASRYMQTPKQVQALKQILRYLKGTTKLGLFYQRGGSDVLHGFKDSSYSADRDDGRSITGMIFFYGERPVTWNFHKQATVALSSCEAEFMAASTAACQAICRTSPRSILRFRSSQHRRDLHHRSISQPSEIKIAAPQVLVQLFAAVSSSDLIRTSDQVGRAGMLDGLGVRGGCAFGWRCNGGGGVRWLNRGGLFMTADGVAVETSPEEFDPAGHPEEVVLGKQKYRGQGKVEGQVYGSVEGT
ncbi:hypothetical protein E3N88_16637 [Mikania micrantha]|uniref:Reverse transcriptase Ty1/copia-type domain-containing protein n=1 Tax=Mikania micrantha TaxID=192012 RepID=A0A5N6P073_9ASTR|nr:hypothetical protein E3N88_16637 [Mikania micrantha]